MAVWGGLQIVVKRREVKDKGEKEIYAQLKALPMVCGRAWVKIRVTSDFKAHTPHSSETEVFLQDYKRWEAVCI